MLQVPRVESYRGFLFVNQNGAAPALGEWLGYMRTPLDDMVDRAPDGERSST
jgi:phenylpropionate dioxygenase-like ring-hydroxylating dioxygenase large terminal subunit